MEWITGKKVLQLLFGPSLHDQTIKRCGEILIFLASMHQFSQEDLVLVWDASKVRPTKFVAYCGLEPARIYFFSHPQSYKSPGTFPGLQRPGLLRYALYLFTSSNFYRKTCFSCC